MNEYTDQLNRLRPTVKIDVDWRGTPLSDLYDADYFLRGAETGKSLYTDYRWLPDLTIPMVCAMVRHIGIGGDDIILDFGCARGYVVKAFREMGYNAHGYDVSEWALANADPAVKDYLVVNDSALMADSYDWVIAKDVLEHVHCAGDVVSDLLKIARVGVFAVVPLAPTNDEPYVVPEYERDVTHIHRFPLHTWAALFMRPGVAVSAQYRVKGIKDNYAGWPMGNGFITARRLD